MSDEWGDDGGDAPAGFGPDLGVESAVDQERGYIAELPERLRGLVCRPTEPWTSERDADGKMPPGGHDHGHTMCYFVNLAADHIEDLRSQLEEAKFIIESTSMSPEEVAAWLDQVRRGRNA